jgi:hypothetical protein
MNGSTNISLSYLLSLAVLVFLCILSLVWYQQRMLFVDPSLVTYTILNSGQLAIQEHRYGALFTQLVPFLGNKMGLPLKYIILFYSLSFQLLYLFVAIVSGSILKQWKYSILMMLYLLLMCSDCFFWPNNEVHQGIAWMLLFFAYLNYLFNNKHNLKLSHYFILFTLLFLSLSSHFIVSIPFLFFWLYQLNEKQKNLGYYRKEWLILTFGIIMISALKFTLNVNSWYDGQKLAPLKKVHIQDIFSVFKSGHWQTMKELFLSEYWIILILILFSNLVLIFSKKYFQVFIFWLILVVYVVLICIVFPDAFDRNQLFYFESEWMAFGLIGCTPFIQNFDRLYNGKWISYILLIIVSLRLMAIINSFPYFNERVRLLDKTLSFMKEKNLSKLLIYANKEQKHRFILDWGTAVESLILSNIRGDKARTFKVVDSQYPYTDGRDSLHACFKMEAISSLNEKYFNLDRTAYQKMAFSTLYK